MSSLLAVFDKPLSGIAPGRENGRDYSLQGHSSWMQRFTVQYRTPDSGRCDLQAALPALVLDIGPVTRSAKPDVAMRHLSLGIMDNAIDVVLQDRLQARR